VFQFKVPVRIVECHDGDQAGKSNDDVVDLYDSVHVLVIGLIGDWGSGGDWLNW
jgi:hypothetical protein